MPTLTCFLTLFLSTVVQNPSAPEPAEPQLNETSTDALRAARRQWADEFLDGPAAHLRLAKVHYDAGSLELAEAICEETRHRFGDDAFDEAYPKVFDFPPAPEPAGELRERIDLVEGEVRTGETDKARSHAEEGLALFPESAELHYLLGVVKDELNEPADEEFDAAIRLAPSSPIIQGWTARRLLKTKKDETAAFAQYLRTYFLNPHFYDTEFAQSRIDDDLGPKLSYSRYSMARDAGDFRDAISMHRVWGVERAVAKMNKEWRPEFVEDAVPLLAHDSSQIRWNTMLVLADKVDDSFDARLDRLLRDDDLRVRGLAIYIAVTQRGTAAYPVAREFLADACPLLRFDAICSLARDGSDEARAILSEHKSEETHPVLRDMLDP